MNKNKLVKIFSVAFALLTVVALFCFFEISANPPADAQTKTKWQRLLEKNGIADTLWEKYLPKITHDEYLKVKDYLVGSLHKKGVDSDFAIASNFPLHQNISTTYFWVGEDGNSDNHNISNSPSCWDGKWSTHFGGVDNPNKRNGFFPAKFKPKENPFYFALPYNDFDSNGKRKSGLGAYIPWFHEKKWGSKESVCKNRWIKIIKGDKIAYAQWEDAGPFGENDIAYVFGSADPKSKTNERAGLDVSPAVRDYLNLSDVDKTSWQFVDAKDVPNGPWKKIVTTSNISWN
jgi:hypothetical protein